MHGLQVGHVTDVRLDYDPAKDTSLHRSASRSNRNGSSASGQRCSRPTEESVAAVLKRGTASELAECQPDHRAAGGGARFRAATRPGAGHDGGRGFRIADDGRRRVRRPRSLGHSDLLDKVNTIPFDQIGKSLNGILKSVNDATPGPAA